MTLFTLRSLRSRARAELHRHRATNPGFRRNRDSWMMEGLRACMGRTGLAGLLLGYVTLAATVTWAEVWNDAACRTLTCPLLMPEALIRTERSEDILREVAGFLLGVQTGLLGVLSIAVALVTIIGQRDHADADVKVYYHESFAVSLAASSLGLLAVITVQLFWPSDFFSPLALGPTLNLTAEATLTGIHLLWLVMNILLYARFTLISLSFGQESSRIRYRNTYTANVSAPWDILQLILRARLQLAPNELPGFPEAGVSMGPHYLLPKDEGVVMTFRRPARLHDVWLTPLAIVVDRWRSRPQPDGTGSRLAFMVNFDRLLDGRVVLCRVHDAASLTWIDRQLILLAFRFRRAR